MGIKGKHSIFNSEQIIFNDLKSFVTGFLVVQTNFNKKLNIFRHFRVIANVEFRMHYTIIRSTKKCNTQMRELGAIQQMGKSSRSKGLFACTSTHTHFLHRNY